MLTWFKITHFISNNKTVKENGAVNGQKVNFLECLVNTDKINTLKQYILIIEVLLTWKRVS
jgi:hypothetical protein